MSDTVIRVENLSNTILLFECAKFASPPSIGGPGGGYITRCIYLANWYKKYVISHQQEGRANYKSLRESISNGVELLGKKLYKRAGKEIYNPAREVSVLIYSP